jgi:hypothetical protein
VAVKNITVASSDTTSEMINKQIINFIEKPTVHIVGGEIGGGGKSTTCEAIGCHYLTNKISFIPIDCDRTTPNFVIAFGSEIYNSWGKDNAGASNNSYTEDTIEGLLDRQIYFEEDEAGYLAPRIITLASKFNQDLIVNLPAQSEKGLRQWIELYDIAGNQEDSEREFNTCFWFVTNGTRDSLDLFMKFYNDYKLPTVLVANEYNRVTDWKNFGYPKEICKLIEIGNIKEFRLPILPLSPKAKQRTYPLTELLKDPTVSPADKMAAKRWCKTTQQRIIKTGFVRENNL